MLKKELKQDYIKIEDILNLIIFENEILRKKLNKQTLSKKEEVFDSFFVSPTSILKGILWRKQK